MKKIISLVCVVAMLFAFAVTANAATTGSMAFEADAEVTVGDEFLVTIKYIPGADSAFKGGTVKLQWNYADGVATMIEEAEGMTDFSSNLINIKPANNIYTVKHAAAATDAWQDLTSEAVFSVVKFKAEKVGTFTLEGVTGTNVTFADAGNTDRLAVKSIAPITITIKDNAPVVPPFVAETVKGEVVEGTDDIVLEKDPATAYDNTYLGTAVFEATLGADVKYGEAGFIWVKDDVESANKFAVDASVIAGGGTFEYAVAMYAIPDGVDIDAIPYYVTAE